MGVSERGSWAGISQRVLASSKAYLFTFFRVVLETDRVHLPA